MSQGNDTVEAWEVTDFIPFAIRFCLHQTAVVFGFFKKKSASPEASGGKAPRLELTPEQKKMINEELERHAEDKGNKLDASIGLLHLTGDKIYLQGLLQFLEDCEIGLLLKAPAGGADFLILTHENLRYLPIFSRPEHAKAMTEKFPAYPHVGLVNSKTLFTKLEPGMGLWINPGHSVFTYMMPPAMFTAYVAMLLRKSAA